LLGAGIWIIEGLNLAPVTAGAYELICLPMRLIGCEEAPARAILK
jgi:arylformamidase